MKSDKWKFVYVTDMQPGSPRSYRFNPAWAENWQTARQQIMDVEPAFMLVGGDVTRDGSIHRWELEEMKDDFAKMNIQYHVIPGNMDTGNKHADRQGAFEDRDDRGNNITSSKLQNWKEVFGDWKWSFLHKNVRVSGFCEMVVNSGLPEEKELWEWLEKQKEPSVADHHLWLMHYPLFIDSPDEPDWHISKKEEYLKWYFSVDMPGRKRLLEVFKSSVASRVISGHVHCMHGSLFGGISFEVAPAVCGTQFTNVWPEGKGKQGFYVYHVEGKIMEREFVPLSKISTREDGYGPSGHPRPESRDYSIAWEK